MKHIGRAERDRRLRQPGQVPGYPTLIDHSRKIIFSTVVRPRATGRGPDPKYPRRLCPRRRRDRAIGINAVRRSLYIIITRSSLARRQPFTTCIISVGRRATGMIRVGLIAGDRRARGGARLWWQPFGYSQVSGPQPDRVRIVKRDRRRVRSDDRLEGQSAGVIAASQGAVLHARPDYPQKLWISWVKLPAE